ncbi:MAG: hypothetical protein AVDCRST_MAG59-2460 [uncultured Thermomicrobiales bacterium]|uniref:Tryptophan-rich sensory protein n=1 Tax=uncultured Thermomicrobiales bacterium TaxID=1645740 RepID=A0A6J4UUH1_9BACT|nr:MAG: hypothetical protein AVDCRST_MAG59-2460 [uncultured Thermomicrobiales bacterium]
MDRGAPATSDRIRQVVVAVLAIAQAVVTTVTGARIREQVDGGQRSPVEPAAWAFAIWGLIFALCIGYGVWQARPSAATASLLRRVGWPTAGAFLTIVGWSLAVPLGLFWLAQLVLLATWAFLAVAAFRLADEAVRRPLSAAEQWCVALPLAPFFGWVTAANGVSLHGQAIDLGVVGPEGLASRLLGATLLLAAGAVAAYIVVRTRVGPPLFCGIYSATIGWAIVGIVVAQWGVEPLIVAAAVVAAVPTMVAVVRVGSLPQPPPAQGTGAA